MDNITLNENDNKLLAFCNDRRRSINEIARYLNIAPKNVSIKVAKLENQGLVIVDRKGKGKKTLVRNKKGIKTSEYHLALLKEIEKRGGEISQEEYLQLLPLVLGDSENTDRFSAPMNLLYLYPPLVERRIKITEEGKKFLEENKN